MKKFEAVILYSPDLSASALSKEENFFTSNIETQKGKIIASEDWGLRDISYNINNYKKSFYKFYQIEIDGMSIQNLKKNITQNEKIIRHLFIKVEEHQQLPTKIMNNEEK